MVGTQAERPYTWPIAYLTAVSGGFVIELIIGGFAVAAPSSERLNNQYTSALLSWVVCALNPSLIALGVLTMQHGIGTPRMHHLLSAFTTGYLGGGEVTLIVALGWLCADARKLCPGAESAQSCQLLYAMIAIGWLLAVLQGITVYLLFVFCLRRMRQHQLDLHFIPMNNTM